MARTGGKEFSQDAGWEAPRSGEGVRPNMKLGGRIPRRVPGQVSLARRGHRGRGRGGLGSKKPRVATSTSAASASSRVRSRRRIIDNTVVMISGLGDDVVAPTGAEAVKRSNHISEADRAGGYSAA